MDNKPGWSFSKRSTLQECPKKYYWRYCYSADTPLGLYINKIKKLDNKFTFFGNYVHRRIESFIKNCKNGIQDTLNDLEKISEEILGFLSKSIDEILLVEQLLNIPVGKDTWSNGVEFILSCLKNFKKSELFNLIKANPKSVESELKIKIENEYGKITAVIDAIIESDYCYIWDWKTGKPKDKDILQLTLYSILLNKDETSKDLQKIKCGILYLGTGEKKLFSPNQDTILQIEKMIEEDCKKFVELSSKEENFFEKRVPRADQICRRCEFFKLCWGTVGVEDLIKMGIDPSRKDGEDKKVKMKDES